LSHKFVTDAREVVKTGQVVKVKVLEVDLVRKRISLTMKLDATVTPHGAARADDNSFRPAGRQERPGAKGGRTAAPAEPVAGAGAMAAAFAKLQARR
jgi:uncharacterized protein